VRERGASEEDTSVIPQAVDFDRIRSVDPDETIDVVYANHLDGTANAESLLLALAELREKDWSAAIVGDGPERDAVEAEVSDLRIDDRVEFVGACDRDERISIYRGAHVFVQTALRENFATELLWALASGCVGIVEYQAESSAHELIETRERTFRATDPQQIADAIVEAGSFERRSVDDRYAAYDEGPIAGRYLDLYERLTSEHGFV
jgi:glycosyltransferase involved in cell wall biosynthesis